jgi:hypothetical protein
MKTCHKCDVIIGKNSKLGFCRQHAPKSGRPPTHGFHGTPFYAVWRSMKARCLNPNHKSYKDYGGRGIEICEDFLSPEYFFEWAVGSGYIEGEGMMIERKDGSRGYYPENCTWATIVEQNRNKRDTKLTLEKAKECRDMRDAGFSLADIARRFSCSPMTASRAVRGISWGER